MNRALTGLLLAALALAPAGATAATPAAGVAQDLRAGFFADVNLGGFFTATGVNNRGDKGVSNAQMYLQLGVGYDIIKTRKPDDPFGLALGVFFGLGSSAASCFASQDQKGQCFTVNDKGEESPGRDNFTVASFGGEVVFKVRLVDRLWLRPRIEGGYALLSPEPVQDSDGKLVGGGAIVGVGVGIEYATHMEHFTIGLDVGGRLIIGPNIPTFAFYPMIKYTF